MHAVRGVCQVGLARVLSISLRSQLMRSGTGGGIRVNE